MPTYLAERDAATVPASPAGDDPYGVAATLQALGLLTPAIRERNVRWYLDVDGQPVVQYDNLPAPPSSRPLYLLTDAAAAATLLYQSIDLNRDDHPAAPVVDLNSLADYPARPDEVTAERLGRFLAVHATYRAARLCTGMLAAGEAAVHAQALSAEWALCHVLQALPRDRADELARDIWTGWDNPDASYELLPAWCARYGVDPQPLIDAAQPGR